MTGELPEDGDVQLGAVRLPRGRRVTPEGYYPVAWVTAADVRDPGPVWAALSALHPQTGLIPVLLDAEPKADAEDFFFYEPVDPRGIDAADPARELAERWQDPEEREETWSPPPTPRSNAFLGLRGRGDGPNSLEDIVGAILGMVTDGNRRQQFERLNQEEMAAAGWPPPGPAPRPGEDGFGNDEPGPAGRPFPGLAPAVESRLSGAERTAALAALPPARICLVPAARPADVLAVTGWFRTDQFQEPSIGVQVGCVLRSWEERFGAHLFKLGPGAELWLLVDRPPRTRAAAEPIAAEHWAFADEFLDWGHNDFGGLVDSIIGRPVWRFWWD